MYQKTCECGVSYVGETKRRLDTRIRDHGRPSSGTAISDHIKTCQHYKSACDESHGDQLNPSVKFSFLKSHFEILHPNLNKYNQRKVLEAVTIKLLKPKLNEQIYHRKVTFI